MNIKNRIVRLEKASTENSGFCDCRETPKVETMRQDLTSDAETTEHVLMGEAVPEFCLRCRRPIEKQVIILQFVESNIPKPEGAK